MCISLTLGYSNTDHGQSREFSILTFCSVPDGALIFELASLSYVFLFLFHIFGGSRDK